MKIEKIEFKNLYSYGEQLQEINYDDTGKLILLKGISGSGKSAILSLPCLLLYGKVGKFPKTAIANRINKNGYIKGTVKQGQHTYIIERKFSPNSITVYKDGENIENYGSKDAQAFIDNEIIDIPQSTYSNIISISLKSFKSFLKMSPADRKQIIDMIFEMEIINNVYENIKKDMRDLGASINADNTTIFSLSQTIQNANIELQKIYDKIQSNNDTTELENNKSLINEYNTKLQVLVDGYNQVALKQQNELQRLNDIKNKQNLNIIEINQIQQKLDLFSNEKCPTCGASFKSEQYDNIKQQLHQLYSEKQDLNNQLNQQMTEITTQYNNTNEYLQKINTGVQKIKNDIYSLNTKNAVIEQKLNSNIEYQSVLNIIEKTTEQLNIVKENIEQKNQEMLDLSTLLSIYSIDGVKQKVINNYIPLLNNEISLNLAQLNIPYILEFDTKFDPHLKDLGTELDPATLSDGEMARIDITVLCSLFKLLKRRYPSINTFTLDEVISTLDNSNSAAMLEFLRVFAIENKLNCFVVSHTDLYIETFNEIINVEKRNGFSTFEITKLS